MNRKSVLILAAVLSVSFTLGACNSPTEVASAASSAISSVTSEASSTVSSVASEASSAASSVASEAAAAFDSASLESLLSDFSGYEADSAGGSLKIFGYVEKFMALANSYTEESKAAVTETATKAFTALSADQRQNLDSSFDFLLNNVKSFEGGKIDDTVKGIIESAGLNVDMFKDIDTAKITSLVTTLKDALSGIK